MPKSKLSLLIISSFFLAACNHTTPVVQDQAPDPTQEVAAPPTNTYSLLDVAGHNSTNDCWIAIEGNVYDVTEFISSHPGGEAILEGCGKEATTLFNTRPMGSGTPHSDRARSSLKLYLIAPLR